MVETPIPGVSFFVQWPALMTQQTSLQKNIEEFTQAGQRLLQQGRPNELLESFTTRFPSSSWKNLPKQLIFSVGEIASQSKSWQLSADLFGHLHDSDKTTPALCLPYSNCLLNLGRLREAELVLKTSLSANPHNPSLLTNLANITAELGEYRQAESLYRQVTNKWPKEFLGHFNLAGFLATLGREDEAIDCYKICLEIVPHAPEAREKLRQLKRSGESEDNNGRKDHLLEIYRLIENRRWEDATQKLDSARPNIDPVRWHSAVLELPEKYQAKISEPRLYNPSTQVHRKDLFNSQDPLLDDLVDYIKQEPSLIWNRAGKPTRSGSQSHEILASRGQSPEIDQLIDRLTDAIQSFKDQYIDSLAKPWPNQIDLSGWAVVLSEGGHQKRHIHPEARLSGVFYVKVPETSTTESAGDCGNLLFIGAENQQTLEITPKAGMVVLFPSFLPHCTAPLNNAGERICIAFNVK